MKASVDEQPQSNANGKKNGKLLGGVTGKGFKPGKSGNPNGRPKGQSITSILRQLLDEPDKKHGTAARAFAKQILKFAQRGGSGDASYAKEVIERIDGKVPTRIANADGSNIEFVDRTTWDRV